MVFQILYQFLEWIHVWHLAKDFFDVSNLFQVLHDPHHAYVTSLCWVGGFHHFSAADSMEGLIPLRMFIFPLVTRMSGYVLDPAML